ncbi:lysozyme [Flavobacterium aciduliphilum]|uniref:Lysozyme n=1 Tax=Flavobacterium aciduliphilum TaxID=1101402 RepID=A0A328YTZ6_9FLAO|nr:lysozyme [Flavobacterium aciduliphilum]RAR75682.1 lysozyme [Flavobacterium aciduliphilum]
MKTASPGIALIKKSEGFKAKPYRCPAGVPTIGYGCTHYPNGKPVTLADPALTEPQATALLQAVLSHYEDGVNRYVQKRIHQNQFDALVSFAYNLGLEALRGSTLLKKVNQSPSDPTIKNEFLKWVHSNGKILPGLVVRRTEEAALYFS